MTNNKIYFIANWKMYGTLNSVQSLKNVIKLKNKQIYNKAKIIYRINNCILVINIPHFI